MCPCKTIAWKTEETEYYTRTTVRPNRHGNLESAQTRRVMHWSARSSDGRIVRGFATKRDALAAIEAKAPENGESK
jgi:hypothetical protein